MRDLLLGSYFQDPDMFLELQNQDLGQATENSIPLQGNLWQCAKNSDTLL
jgi:hypothetical protein